jgi:hypothetical protein
MDKKSMAQEFWTVVIDILKVLIPVVVASVPGFIALRQQRIKNEAENVSGKGKAEEDKIQADTTASLLTSAGVTQKAYQELIGDIKQQNKDCINNVEFLRDEVKELTNKLDEFRSENKQLTDKVDKLEKIILILVHQLQALGQTPECEDEIKELIK